MLSPHEFATLMLIEGTQEPNGSDLSPDDLAALVERQLVRLEQRASGYVRPGLTRDGKALLQRIRKLQQTAR